jgi:hypothetical protein
VRTRRLFGAGLWLATTAAATALVWAATSVVAADVTDRPAPVVPHRDVVSALATPPANPETSPTTAPPKVPSSTLATTSVVGPSTSSSAARSTSTTNPTQSTTFVPFSVPTTVPATPPTTRPTGPTTTPAPQVTATYSTEGGVVTVACTGPSSIRLVSATPADGYFVFVVSGGPQYVGLQFHSANNGVTVGASCVFGLPHRFDNSGQPPPTG